MNTRIYASLSLIGMGSSTVSPGKNTVSPIFPQWPTIPNVTTYSASSTLATAALGGYQCIRANLNYGFPQGVTSNTVATTLNLQAFFGTKEA